MISQIAYEFMKGNVGHGDDTAQPSFFWWGVVNTEPLAASVRAMSKKRPYLTDRKEMFSFFKPLTFLTSCANVGVGTVCNDIVEKLLVVSSSVHNFGLETQATNFNTIL